MKRFSVLFLICACAAGAYSQTQNFYQASSFHTNVFLHDLPAVPLHTRLSGYLTNESLWIAASNSVVRTNDTRTLDWTGATITIADASASNNPVTYGQLTNGLAEKSGTGTVAAIDGRVTTLEGQTNSYVLTNNATFLSVLKTMTNFTAVASSSNFLSYDPVTRTLSGCVTNAGSGTGSATNWYAYAQNDFIFRIISGNGTNTLNANPTNSATDFTLDWQGISQYVGVDSEGRTNLIFKEYNVTYYGSGGTNWLWYYNLAEFPHDQVPYAHMTNISTFPTGVWFKGDAGNASPVASGDTATYDYALTNQFGFTTNLRFAVVSNGVYRYPLDELDALQARTSTWDQAATDASSATGAIAVIQASTSNWNTAYGWGDHGTNGYGYATNYIPRATNEPPTAGHVLKAGDTTGTNVYWDEESGVSYGTTSTTAYRGDWGAAVSGQVATASYKTAFLAVRGSNQTGFTNNTNVKVLFTNQVFDLKSDYDPATGRWTPAYTGVIFMSASVGFDNSAPNRKGDWYVSIYKNGERWKDNIHSSGTEEDNYPNPSISVIDNISGTGDYYEVYGRVPISATNAVLGNTVFTWFSGSSL